MRRGSVVVVLLAMFSVPGPAVAGVVVQFEQPSGRSTYTAEGKKLRMETVGEHAEIMIFDGDAQKLFRINQSDHTYSEITQADAKGVSAQIDEMLSKLPPERRAMMEERMKQAGTQTVAPRPVTYEPTGARQTVAGYACQGYRMVRDGKASEQGCFIPWGTNAVQKADLGALVEFGNFMQRFMSAAWGAGPRRSGSPITDQLERAPGFPAVMERVTEGGKVENAERLVSLKHTGVPAETFTVPPGYTKVTMPGFGAGGPRNRN